MAEATLGDKTIIFVTDCYEMLSPRIYNIDIDNLCNTCMVFNILCYRYYNDCVLLYLCPLSIFSPYIPLLT